MPPSGTEFPAGWSYPQRMKTRTYFGIRWGLKCIAFTSVALASPWITLAQINVPHLEDPNLSVRTITTNVVQPTGMAFIGRDDMLVLEKASGKVQRIVNGILTGTVLDLAVNSGSERGLLGIALHPDFPSNP